MPGRIYAEGKFDPKYILVQILALQSIFYLSQAALIILFDHQLGVRAALGQIFSSSLYDTHDSYSMAGLLSVILTVPIVVISFVFVVERANKCIDFGCTLYFVHLCIHCLVNGFPLNSYWWIVNAALLVVTVLASEYCCMKVEQKEIKIQWFEEKNEN